MLNIRTYFNPSKHNPSTPTHRHTDTHTHRETASKRERENPAHEKQKQKLNQKCVNIKIAFDWFII